MVQNLEHEIVDVPLIGRFALLIAYSSTLDSTLTALAPCIVIILTVTVQPYKTTFAHYSKIDVFFWGCVVIFYSLAQGADFDFLKSATECGIRASQKKTLNENKLNNVSIHIVITLLPMTTIRFLTCT